ncbi:hypothetical protein CTRI78_v011415 [Colletotrichum trifolii]|uniref:AHC1-like C2H2 zinc-finger domain-containing protein n=1 Tax=Colletotrichum trifolii TaxID=5466 RepID=A0A4R8QB04_COLTR|nr:hypothetical protein CTRI78_v011415 [Colletotrichum trifolii]
MAISNSVRPPKRPLSVTDDSPPSSHVASVVSEQQPLKRVKREISTPPVADLYPCNPAAVAQNVPAPAAAPALGTVPVAKAEVLPASVSAPTMTNDLEDARDTVQYQFGMEILLKHNELRLINQELAKCQVALEQLRRCHLIPYPTTCPTPAQMLDIANGKGPVVQNRPGEPVPQWAPPYGVVDGPYARHYAKWLIPDPKFDGMQPEWYPVHETARSRSSAEGRTTRNSMPDLASANKHRSTRGVGSQKLQSLSSGYPQPKEKAGPCTLKRSDGKTVKLVCLDCHRENFSSTQGFINHCRIAHRRDFKSHEEAAVHCGHPIEVNEGGGIVGEEKPPAPAPAVASGLVHPLAQTDMSTQQACASLLARIQDSLKLYKQGKLPSVQSIPGLPPKSEDTKPDVQGVGDFVGSTDTPFLSQLMRNRNFRGNLGDIVSDAKEKVLEDIMSLGEESEEAEPILNNANSGALPAARVPSTAMRVPARAVMSPVIVAPSTRPVSSKGRSPHLGFASPPLSSPDKDQTPRLTLVDVDDVDMDVDMSPNTMVSNNAPSLVSDDGEYDDSDDGSSEAGVSDRMDAESVSDVAEITLDEDHEARPISHHRGTNGVRSGTAMRLKKDENKHVTFVSSVNSAKRTKEF